MHPWMHERKERVDEGTVSACPREEGVTVRRSVSVVATLLLMSIAAVAGAVTPEKVLNEPGVDEVMPSVSGGYLVWTADSDKHPQRYNSYVMAEGGTPVRLNRRHTQGPGASIDGDTVVYQEDTSAPADEDLWFFDPVTRTRTAPPRSVNTPKFEFRPSLSGDWLLFTRTNANLVPLENAWVKVVLYDLSTGEHRALKTMHRPYLSSYLSSEQVNGNWASFESCRQRDDKFFNCQVYLYDIGTGGDSVRVANPGVQQYGGSVSADGTVYLMRNRSRDHFVCGNSTALVRVPLTGSGVVIWRLPEGMNAYNSFAQDDAGGSTTVYFDPFPCRTDVGGIYRIENADAS